MAKRSDKKRFVSAQLSSKLSSITLAASEPSLRAFARFKPSVSTPIQAAKNWCTLSPTLSKYSSYSATCMAPCTIPVIKNAAAAIATPIGPAAEAMTASVEPAAAAAATVVPTTAAETDAAIDTPVSATLAAKVTVEITVLATNDLYS